MLSAIFKKEQAAEAAPESASTGLWQLAMRRLKRDRIAMFSLYVVLFYLLLLVLSMSGLIAKDWNKEVAVSYAPPSFISAAPVP
ncbi:MAG TPA: peptide ABC transporter permease, partial [Acinetobacter lwoffii]|nr:peptide ABC transporter permease [Acinetobacter lwoffii]